MNSSVLYIIRHGERLDEIDPEGWVTFVENTYRAHKKSDNGSNSIRNKRSFIADAPLTPRGIEMAREMAQAFCVKLSAEYGDIDVARKLIGCIYSSRLLRAVQTAREVAVALNLPIVICSQLSRTAEAVNSHPHNHRCSKRGCVAFEYMTMSQIREYCTGVTMYTDDVYEGETAKFYCDGDIHTYNTSNSVVNQFACPVKYKINIASGGGDSQERDWHTPIYNISMKGEGEEVNTAVGKDQRLDTTKARLGFDDDDLGGEVWSLEDDDEKTGSSAPIQPVSALATSNSSSTNDSNIPTRLNVMVAHRESIRGLEERNSKYNDIRVNWRRTRLPYCAIGKYTLLPGANKLLLAELCNHMCERIETAEK